MAENNAFSSSGEDAITRAVEIDENEVAPARDLSPEEFAAFYELDRVASEIESGGFKRVRLASVICGDRHMLKDICLST